MASSGVGEQDRRGEDSAKAGKSGSGIVSTEVCNKQEQDGRHKVEDRHEERYSKVGSDRERKDPPERRISREHGQRDSRLVLYFYAVSISDIEQPLFLLPLEDCFVCLMQFIFLRQFVRAESLL